MEHHDTPMCSRCGKITDLLSRLILHRDTDQQDKETSYWNLCGRCVRVVEECVDKLPAPPTAGRYFDDRKH